MKFSLLMDTAVLKEYFNIKKTYLSAKNNILKLIFMIIIFVILIGITIKIKEIDDSLKVFIILILVLILIMYLSYRFARYQYFNSVNYHIKNTNIDYLYTVQIISDLMISDDDGNPTKIKIDDITNIYQGKNIYVVSDSYNDIIFAKADFARILEQYPRLEEVPITKVKQSRIKSKKNNKKNKKGD